MVRFFKSAQAFMLSAAMVLSTTAFHMEEAEARRAGGGGSFGRSSSSSIFSKPSSPAQSTTTNRSSTTQTDAARTQSSTGAASTANAPRRNSFLGPLGGIAAGLGLAALFSYMGFGEGMASILGTLLMIALAFFGIRMIFRMMSGQAGRQKPAFGQASAGSGYGQTGSASSSSMDYAARTDSFGANRQSLPRQAMTGAAVAVDSATKPVSPHEGIDQADSQSIKELPAGFDEAKFLVSAKQFFVMIQEAYDKAEMDRLREYATDEVYRQFASEISQRAGAENHTSVVSLEAELIGFETDVDEQIATVAFSAMMRESKGGMAEDVQEFWILTRPTSGGGWVLAGLHNL